MITPRKISVFSGFPTETTIPFSFVSYSNAQSTLAIDGQTITILNGDWVALGTDHPDNITNPEACFTATKTVTVSAGFVNFPYTFTQSLDIINGNCRNAPGVNDDFLLIFVSCDNNTIFTNLTGSSSYTIKGMWGDIRDKIEQSSVPCAGIFFVDDHGYNSRTICYSDGDSRWIVDVLGNKYVNGGVVSDPLSVPIEWNYTVAWLVYMGMVQEALGTDLDATFNFYQHWGRDEDRRWAYDNNNLLPQWGDWEFQNDLGFDLPNSPIPTQTYLAGKAVWDAIYGPLQPSLLNASNSNAWTAKLGSVSLFALDGVSNGNGNHIEAGSPPIGSYTFTSMYGTSQIADIKTALSTDTSEFKLIGASNGIRYLIDNPNETNGGTQHPVYNHVRAEFDSLFVANDGQSIMANPATNGSTGVTVFLNGDVHYPSSLKFQAPANGGNLAENFWQFYSGAVNASANQIPNVSLIAGGIYKNVLLNYIGSRNIPELKQNTMSYLKIDVNGSATEKKMDIRIQSQLGIVEARRFRVGTNDSNEVTNDMTTFRNAKNADATHTVDGSEVLGSARDTQLDTNPGYGDPTTGNWQDSGMQVEDVRMFISNFWRDQFLLNPGLKNLFAGQAEVSAKEMKSIDIRNSLDQSTGNFSLGVNGSINSTGSIVNTSMLTPLSVNLNEDFMMFCVYEAFGGVSGVSIGPDYSTPALDGIFLKHGLDSAIYRHFTTSKITFPGRGGEYQNNSTIALAMTYDSDTPANCRRYISGLNSANGTPLINNDLGTVVGTPTGLQTLSTRWVVSGGLYILGLIRMTDITTITDSDVMQGLDQLQVNPYSGVPKIWQNLPQQP